MSCSIAALSGEPYMPWKRLVIVCIFWTCAAGFAFSAECGRAPAKENMVRAPGVASQIAATGPRDAIRTNQIRFLQKKRKSTGAGSLLGRLSAQKRRRDVRSAFRRRPSRRRFLKGGVLAGAATVGTGLLDNGLFAFGQETPKKDTESPFRGFGYSRKEKQT